MCICINVSQVKKPSANTCFAVFGDLVELTYQEHLRKAENTQFHNPQTPQSIGTFVDFLT